MNECLKTAIRALSAIELADLRRFLDEGIVPHLRTFEKMCRAGLVERDRDGYRPVAGLDRAMQEVLRRAA